MKLHIITIGQPKLSYAQAGWAEYLKRLSRFHQVRTTHLADKWADDASKLLETAGNAYKVALVIGATQFTSEELATFLRKHAEAGQGREVCFLIGGPEGLPVDIIQAADFKWSFSELTFPHDLAMVICAEALYRASSINAGQPYHRG